MISFLSWIANNKQPRIMSLKDNKNGNPWNSSNFRLLHGYLLSTKSNCQWPQDDDIYVLCKTRDLIFPGKTRFDYSVQLSYTF